MYILSADIPEYRNFNDVMGFRSVPFMYLHGELESHFCFDLFTANSSFPMAGPHVLLNPGKYPVVVNGIEGACTLYIYKRADMPILGGLVVLNSDKESVAYAESLGTQVVML
jgi:hypothetical protein